MGARDGPPSPPRSGAGMNPAPPRMPVSHEVAVGSFMAAVWTIGHSTRTLEELVALLRTHAIATLADVRTVPRSRRHPQFEKTALAESLPRAGIVYTHEPGLGGLRKPHPDSVNTGWRNPG